LPLVRRGPPALELDRLLRRRARGARGAPGAHPALRRFRRGGRELDRLRGRRGARLRVLRPAQPRSGRAAGSPPLRGMTTVLAHLMVSSMSAIFKKVGLLFIAFDLLVVASAGVLHTATNSAPPTRGAKTSSAQLEQIVSATSGHTSCSSDPTDGWDYYCVSADGSRGLYDVSVDGVTQRSDLPSYR